MSSGTQQWLEGHGARGQGDISSEDVRNENRVSSALVLRESLSSG